MSVQPESTTGIVCSPHPDIRVRAVNIDGTVLTIVLEGQIRYQSVASLQEFVFEQFCTQMPQSMILDFREISFLDSQGIALLISIYKFCYPQGCTLSILGAPPHVRSLILLTRLNAFIKLI